MTPTRWGSGHWIACLIVVLAGCAAPSPSPVSPPARGAMFAAGDTSPASREYPPGVTPPDAAPHEFILPGGAPGDQLYATFCATCHGSDGRGGGRAAAFTRVPPADFTRAEFKVRSTPLGALPSDGDLADVIRKGLGGDGAMPAFAFFSDADLRAIVHKVKSFSPRWTHESSAAPGPRLPLATGHSRPKPDNNSAKVSVDTATAAGYWRPPLRAGHDSVTVAGCAACHPLQFADWSRSRHAMAMSPGLWAQMQERDTGGDCLRCHAPLAEQAKETYLTADGVSCAACHVRAGQTFGPAPTPSTLLPLVAGRGSVHGKVQTRAFFENSEFCSSCHHFPAGSAPLVAGTTLQNTHEEWRNSRAAREGRTCQTCHMPDRRHFFRGIHDPDTVRRSVRWTFESTPRAQDVKARMTLTNIGAGHYLPTYVVAEIWMRIDVKDSAGATLAFAEHRIARKVKPENGGWTQTSDTRLAPDQTARLEFNGPLPPAAVTIVGRVIVLPDVWQAEKFRDRLATAQSDTIRKYYSAALEEAESSGYTLFQEERRLDQ